MVVMFEVEMLAPAGTHVTLSRTIEVSQTVQGSTAEMEDPK